MGKTKSTPLVSIVVPVYNAERFIQETIASVQAQTYQNWELLLVDDRSNDKSVILIQQAQKDDKRIKIIKMPKNGGAAKARNKGTEVAKGRYLAFLDADDLWKSSKLEEQVAIMIRDNLSFSFTSYEFADKNGVPTGKKAIVPNAISYDEALKRSSISTITVMIDLTQIARDDVMMPELKTGEDVATWWLLLRKYGDAQGIQQVLSYYRRGAGGTLSSNKIQAAKQRWALYRAYEKLPLFDSIVCFYHYAAYALQRRV